MFLKSTRNLQKFHQRWMTNPFLYNLLKIDSNASKTQIKKNYHQECMKYHPDHEGGTANQFLEINKAFQILDCPKKKQLYDGLDHMQYQEFLGIWKINFHENRSKIEKLEQYQKTNSRNPFSIVVGYVVGKLINRYNQLIVYDQQKVEKCTKFNQSRHIYFILDKSSSMACYDTTDSNYTSVPKNITRSGFNDGSHCNFISIDEKYRYIADQSIYIKKSIKNIKLICEQLKTPAHGYLTSFMTFSQHNHVLWQYEPLESVLDKIGYICADIDNLRDNQFTHIYDALKSAIDSVKENGNLSLTNFVLVTDGLDFKSQTPIEEILRMVKDINIIILTINVKETSDLKKICDNAKSGQLLKIGEQHDYGFGTFEDSFSKTKDLILYNHNISFINIKKEFDL